MAKLTLLVFTIATLLALSSAHRTIITTTIEDDTNPSSQQCGQHLQGQQFQQCQTHLQQQEFLFPSTEQRQTLEQCCQELQNVDQQCQCNAVKKIFAEVQQQQQPQGGIFGSLESRRLKQRAENLPNRCNLQTAGRQCRIKSSRKCRQHVEQRVNSCQDYLEHQLTQGRRRTSVAFNDFRPDIAQRFCCEELTEDVGVECQCEAMQEVFNYLQRLQERRGKAGEDVDEMRRMVEGLKNICNLEVQQCQLKSGMF